MPPYRFLAVDWNGTVVPFFGLDPYPAALEALSELRADGMAIHVVSHATQTTITRDVKRVGLVVDGIWGVRHKDDVCRQLAEQLGRGAVLGDHPADQRAAQAAGLDFYQALLEGQPLFPDIDGSFNSWLALRQEFRI